MIGPRILIVEARFYEDIADELARGARAELERQGASFETVSVPGALEVPQALGAAIASGLFAGAGAFDGCVALGCVIRGQTSHYDIVANESARGLLTLAITHHVPVGNGMLTVENHAQAMARAAVSGKNKGRDAAAACLRLIAIRRGFERKGKA